jgi:hypothetical protein
MITSYLDQKITPVTELSERNLLLIVKIPIGWHKVTKILIDSGVS